MVRGRRPTPAAQKRLTGNPGKRPVEDREPKVEAAELEPPDWLDADALAEWTERAPELHESKITSKQDRAIFTLYTLWWSQLVWTVKGWKQYRAMISQQDVPDIGPVLLSGRTNSPYISPWLGALSAITKHLRALCTDLGMTPASRTRIKALTDLEDDDPMMKLLQQRGMFGGGSN